MRRDRDTALCMDSVNSFNRRPVGADRPGDAYGDQVIVRVRDLLPAYQDRPICSAANPLRKASGHSLIVVCDCYHVEARADCFVAEVGRRQAAVSRKCMHVKIAGKNPEFTSPRLRSYGTFIGKSPDRQSCQTEKRRSKPCRASSHSAIRRSA